MVSEMNGERKQGQTICVHNDGNYWWVSSAADVLELPVSGGSGVMPIPADQQHAYHWLGGPWFV